MVGSRVLIYHLVGRAYDFGPVLTGFIYEYRKDVVAYVPAAGLIFYGTAQNRRSFAMDSLHRSRPATAVRW